MGMHWWPQRFLDAIDRAEHKARATGAEDERRDHHMQTIETPGAEKARNRFGAAFDEDTAQPEAGEAGKDCGRCNISVCRRQLQHFGAGKLASAARRSHDDPPGAFAEETRVGRKPAARINDDPDRIGAVDTAHRQLRIVGARGFNPNYDGIDQRPQPVEMRQSGGAVDIVRTPGRRRRATVKGLTDLSYDNEIIDVPGAQRPEYILPR
jgi:hypothetical protein